MTDSKEKTTRTRVTKEKVKTTVETKTESGVIIQKLSNGCTIKTHIKE